ncbi:MAG: TolC family protein [Planctomycetes bacterium]|nr:TolC family protein [Planctomycetota bacterium]
MHGISHLSPGISMPRPSPFLFQRHAGATTLVASLAILIAVTGCSDASVRAPDAPVPPPLDAPAPPPVPPAAERSEDWSGSVAMTRLVAAAQASHPTTAAIQAARTAAAAQVRQAGVWSNPELEVSLGQTKPRMDGVERDSPYGGSLSQRLTWWGVRNARIAAARAQQGAAEAEAQVSLLGLQADVRRAAIIYAAATEAALQAEDEARIASELAALTETRLTAGEADRATVARARLEATTTALQRDARRREVATALAALRIWCDPALPDGLVIADALGSDAPLDSDRLSSAAERHPQLRALAETAGAAAAAVDAERQSRVPDLTVGVFADRENEKDTYGVTLGFEIPLWNQNEAGIAAAEAERAKVHAAARSERLRLRRDLAEALGAAQTAQREATSLTTEAMPVAEEAIRLRQAAFQAGEASLSDLMEARRAVLAVRAELRDARRRAALAVVDLGMAVGDPSLGADVPDAARP